MNVAPSPLPLLLANNYLKATSGEEIGTKKDISTVKLCIMKGVTLKKVLSMMIMIPTSIHQDIVRLEEANICCCQNIASV